MNDNEMPEMVILFQKYFREAQQEIPGADVYIWSQCAMLMVLDKLHKIAKKADLHLANGLDSVRKDIHEIQLAHSKGGFPQ